MHLLPQDERSLARALTLAREAAPLASPNPSVGCVLTQGEHVIGEGAHLYDNFDHAEIVALNQAAREGHATQGATAFVTLEPCSHHGRTGPCADALIAAAIARCVIATSDPNPQVSGRGIAKLRAARIEVTVLDLASPHAQQARRLNDAFAFSIQHHRPFVTLKSAVSIDGRIAPPPQQRSAASPVWLTGNAARADVQHLRHTSDAILTGIGTVLADDPQLTDRTGLPRRRPLLRVVLDSHLRLPLNAALLTSVANDLLVITTSRSPTARQDQLRSAGGEVVVFGSPTVPLTEVLKLLHERSIRSVLLEAGSHLNAAFLAADLVDRTILYFSEMELSHDAVPFATGGESPYTLTQRLASLTRASFAHAASSTLEDIRLSGYLHDPWPPTR